MSAKYEVHEFGSMDVWTDHNSNGRAVIDHAMNLDFFGVSINALLPGKGVDFWHAHSVLEELYLFLEGEGEMALDDEIVPVKGGTAVRVGQGVMRTWRAKPDGEVALKWICIRAGGAKLKDIGRDATPIRERPLPWK